MKKLMMLAIALVLAFSLTSCKKEAPPASKNPEMKPGMIPAMPPNVARLLNQPAQNNQKAKPAAKNAQKEESAPPEEEETSGTAK